MKGQILPMSQRWDEVVGRDAHRFRYGHIKKYRDRNRQGWGKRWGFGL